MAVAANADSTLQTIQTKVRRLTRTPSTAQLSDADIQQYINTFVIYDFPEHLRMFNLRKPFTFYANPYQTSYVTDTTLVETNPLYNFQNLYITVHPPVYIGGFQSFYTQSREEFFGIYPQVNSIAQVNALGDGVTTRFSGTVNSQQALVPSNLNQKIVLEQNQVLFSSVSSLNQGLSLVDVPVQDPVTGGPSDVGNLYDPNLGVPTELPTIVLPNNNINYVSGVYTATFTTAPGDGQQINSQTVPLCAARPQALLWHDNKFRLRPVPDQPYRVNFEVYVRPTALLDTEQTPGLEEWWQYIAYGAAKKVFEDRMDIESVQMIMPEFLKQQALCQRRTIVQYTNERVATIYTDGVCGGVNGAGWGWGGSGQF